MDEVQAQAMTEAEQLEALEATLGVDVPAWQPEAGQILSGTITNLETRASEYGLYPAVTIRQLNGDELVFHAFRTVAQNELKRLKPEVGDLIAVSYLGTAKGTDYHGYKIRVSREVSGAGFDWDSLPTKDRPKVEG